MSLVPARALLWAATLLAVQGPACGPETCEHDAECGPDAYCPAITCRTGCNSPCPRQCTPRAWLGEPCELDMRLPELSPACVEGLVCNTGAGGLCTERQRPGGPCGNDHDCLGSEAADGPSCSAWEGGTCVVAGSLGAGARCIAERACGPDLTCGDVCLAALAAGADCSIARESCRDGLSCVAGRCGP